MPYIFIPELKLKTYPMPNGFNPSEEDVRLCKEMGDLFSETVENLMADETARKVAIYALQTH